MGPQAQDRLRFALAAALFGVGEYAAARRLHDAVENGPLREEADRMVDWIDYKLGHVARGWPRYPVARFTPPALATVAPGGDPVLVHNFNRPTKLVQGLGLRPWQPGAPNDLPVLVWFNFHDSLGGEVLAALVAKAFQHQTGTRLMLAVGDRHVSEMRSNFPRTEVIGKTTDLRQFAGRVAGYLLARDALAQVVRTESGFAHVAARTFVASSALPPAVLRAPARSRPVLAVAWKTTNRRQQRFRNLPIAAIAMLLAGINAYFVSAQHGATPAERAFLSRRLGDRIRFDRIDPSGDLASLAGGLAACDGVVTVDNSVLHIAGAFGVPTLGLLAMPSYWAWPATGPDSRW